MSTSHALGLLVVLASTSAPALADETPYCRAAHARAKADAALLMWPQIVAQAVRFPAGATSDVALSLGPGQFQLRAGLAFSPLDLAKGLRLTGTAEAQCEQHEAQLGIEALLVQGNDAGRLPALRNQGTFLRAQQPTWQMLLAKEEERFAAHLISRMELDQVRKQVADLERKVVQAEGEAERLEAVGIGPLPSAPERLARLYEARSADLERSQARVRALSAWQVRLTGGAAFSAQSSNQWVLDWYGLVEVSFNAGAFVHSRQERRYLDARAEELRQARYEPTARLGDFLKQQRVTAIQARHELELLERQAATVTGTLRSLESSDMANIAHTVASLTLDKIWIESEQRYLCTLIDQLSTLTTDR
jgi:hypothetical protein